MDLEMDQAFDRSPQARIRRFTRKILDARFTMIALLLHILILLIFGGKIIFEAVTKVEIVGQLPSAPKGVPNQPIAPNVPKPQKPIEVQVTAPKTVQKSLLATDKLSADFTVTMPDLPMTTGLPMEGFSPGGGGGGGAGGPGLAAIKFFNITTEANSIMFMVDISQTMADKDDYSDVEREFAKSLRALKDDNLFNVVTFAKTAYAFRDAMTPATIQNKEAAITWLRRLNPVKFKINNWGPAVNGIERFHLGTHAHLAIPIAFEQKPDMMIFISDGEVNGMAKSDILAMVQQHQNKMSKRISINVACYKSNEGDKTREWVDFMQKLAKQNNGQFTWID
jgi:hypothetical protein